jgi:HSP20 family protein
MPLIRWQPLKDIELWEPIREIEGLQKEMNRLFDRFMHPGNAGSKGIIFTPSIQMEETAEAVHLKLEVPGMEAKDIDVQVAEDSVRIIGERREETKTEETSMVRSEFHYGKFERMIPLPVSVQNTKVTAEYKDGILSLILPKSEEEKKKVVKVNLG